MKHRPLILLGTAAAGAALMFGVVACGSSDDEAASPATTAVATATAPATTAQDPTDGPVVEVTMGTPQEFSMVPAVTSEPAGNVTFTVTNGGAMVHEFVVVATDTDAASLPTEADGSAKEDGAVGEIPDMEPGSTKSVTLNLKAGKYALICNIPGHYAGGMRADFTVQ